MQHSVEKLKLGRPNSTSI